MDKLQPFRCGCGGKAMLYVSPITTRCLLQCESCKIETAFYDTEAEAITAWNKAMGNFPKTNIQKIDAVIPVKCEYGDEKTVFASGYICPNCYTHVVQLDKYCSECGMKLDWNNYV